MHFLNDKNIGLFNTILSLSLIVIATLTLGYLFMDQRKTQSQERFLELRQEGINAKKRIIKDQVSTLINTISFQHQRIILDRKKAIKAEVEAAYTIAKAIYDQNHGKRPESEIRKLIIETLRPIRHHQGIGYYFLERMDGTINLMPPSPHIEGKNFIDDNLAGQSIFKKIRHITKTQNEGYLEYEWPKPNTSKATPKITYVKYFEPLDWIIGTGYYVEDITLQVQDELLEYASQVRYANDGYFSIYHHDGTILMIATFSKLNGLNIHKENFRNTFDIVSNLIELSKQPKGGFYRYEWNKPSLNEPVEKIAYAASYPEWQWTITTGVYIDDLDQFIEEQKSALLTRISLEERTMWTILFTVLLSALLVTLFVSQKINDFFRDYRNQITRKNSELVELNAGLEQKIKEAVEKYREQEQIMIQRSRMADMGEMIGSIAHQWRQPLNALALHIQDLEDAYDYDELDRDYLQNMIERSMQQIDYMSETIDDFRNFFAPAKASEPIVLQKSIEELERLFGAQLKSHNITLTIEIESSIPEIMGYKNELQQVFINLLNNAKDAIKENGEIHIKASSLDEDIFISIEDSGGGIPDAILHKIFDPYFTTKHKSKGTGIGLYMVKTIVEKMGGEIEAYNIPNGARFNLHLKVDHSIEG